MHLQLSKCFESPWKAFRAMNTLQMECASEWFLNWVTVGTTSTSLPLGSAPVRRAVEGRAGGTMELDLVPSARRTVGRGTVKSVGFSLHCWGWKPRACSPAEPPTAFSVFVSPAMGTAQQLPVKDTLSGNDSQHRILGILELHSRPLTSLFAKQLSGGLQHPNK